MTGISIIFVSYKSKGLVRQNLLALESFTAHQYEVIVVDNNSGDGLQQMMYHRFAHTRHPMKVLALSFNKGFAYGVNKGIQLSRHDVCLIMNPDVVINEDAVQTLAGVLAQNPRVGIVGPRLLQPDGEIQPSCFAFPSFFMPLYRRTVLKRLPRGKANLQSFVLEANADASKPQQVDWLQGSCMMIKKSALRNVGPMDEHFFMYFEDTDWCRRFVEKGWQVWYVPEGKMVHYFNRWSAEYEGMGAILNPATWIHIRSWLYYFWKWRR